MSAHGKRYTAARAKIDRENLYSPVEAIKILKDIEGAKFDETVEVHFRLGLNVRHADEQLRGTLMLPHGTGRVTRVAVFAEGDKAREAEEAGADIVGSADLAAKIEGGFTDFDVAIATPDQMGNVGKLGRVLGPRGLMPNPKTGTVTFDVAKAVSDAKAGKLEYRTDRGANVHVAIGKKSFDERSLVENYAALVEEIVRAKPASVEGPLHQGHHADVDDGPRPARRSDAGARHRRGARGGRSVGRGAPLRPDFSDNARRRRQPAAPPWGRSPAEVRSQDGNRPAGASREAPGGCFSFEPASVRARCFERRWKMQKADKERVIAELTERLSSADALLVADYRGLTNSQLASLRVELLKHGAKLSVVKNTLTRRAAEAAGADALLAMLEGPTAIAFVEADGNAVAVAKALSDAAKDTKILALRGGVLSGNPITGDEIERLAKLPPLEVLQAQLVGVIVAPLTQLAAVLNAPLQNLVGLINARITQLEEGGDTSAAATEEAAPAAEAVEAPVDEAVAEEAPAEEAPAEEAPADEVATEEVVAEAEADETVAEATEETPEA